ncbi:TraB/GumN family protein [Brevundimonas sp.]|uniref:TraB/GumN family protein n=1 Tax=Brevundimonas sp. TaxID=1871086 RepID=UPI002ABB42DF|nr:TraB/GumN family protein [Brevundimonas sp.]MDZ4361919.1 TraB/GumN family protein [Brevundimonas sp.]
MTLIARLKTTASTLGRTTLGAALGLGLFAAVAGGLPSAAFAQDAAAAPAPAAPRVIVPATGQGPALWVVRDADSTIYLFGTVHVLRPDTAWGSPVVDAAFDASSEIWFEITNPDDQAAALPLMQQYGFSPNRPLSSILTADDLAKLDVAAQSIGVTAAQMDPLRPWLVALTLSVAPLAKAGYDANSGVELVLRSRAEAAGKPIRGLETMEGQLGVLAGLSEETQIAFLRSTLEDFEQATVELDRLVAAWATGDVEGVESIGVTPMMEASTEVYDALLTKRNADWTGQIQTMLAGSGTVFIAVGAAHLAGDDSVQEMLEDRGVTVERVQP